MLKKKWIYFWSVLGLVLIGQAWAQQAGGKTAIPFDKLSPQEQEKIIRQKIEQRKQEMQQLIDRDQEQEEVKKGNVEIDEKAIKKANFQKRTASGKYYLLFGLSDADINNLKNFDPNIESKYKVMTEFIYDEYGDFIIDFSEKRKQEYVKHSIEFLKYFYGRYMLVYKNNNNLNEDPFGDKIINEIIDEYKTEVDQAWANKDVQAATYGARLMTDRRLRNDRLNKQILSKIEKYTKEMKLDFSAANNAKSPEAEADFKQTLNQKTSWIDDLKLKLGVLILIILAILGIWIYQSRPKK